MEKEQITPEEQLKLSLGICIANLELTRKYPNEDQIYEHLLKFIQSEAVGEYWQAQQLPAPDDLETTARTAVSYDRQVAVCGHEAAETVKQFWIMGFNAGLKHIKPLPTLAEGKVYVTTAGGALYEDMCPGESDQNDDQDTIRTSKPLF